MSKNEIVALFNVEELGNNELRVSARKIEGAEFDMKERMKVIACELAHIQHEKLYELDGFKSTADFAEKVFGYKHSAVSKMLSVANNLLRGDVNSWKNWNMTQLQELLPLTKELEVDFIGKPTGRNIAHVMLENGDISPDMTKDELRKVVQKHRPSKGKAGIAGKADSGDDENTIITEDGVEVENTSVDWEKKYNNLQKEVLAIYDMMLMRGDCQEIISYMVSKIEF